MFLYLPEETFDIRLRLSLSEANVTAHIEVISGFCFFGCQIRKFNFPKVGSSELNENYGAFLLSSGNELRRDNQKLESSALLLNASFIAFGTLNSANSSASSALGSISVLNGSLYHETFNVSSLNYDLN